MNPVDYPSFVIVMIGLLYSSDFYCGRKNQATLLENSL